ncbi:MAG: ABC transporter permease subunit [Hyphomicrobiales bacterium]|nr:ABC transporter permease subunit [Hyphomicrobiales bacterium]
MSALHRFVDRVPPVYSLLIWIALWEIVGQLDLAFILPPFSAVIEQLYHLVQRPIFLSAAATTLKAFVIGMAIAISGGITIGFVMGRFPTANGVLGMWVNIFASAPLSSLVPVLMLLFGLGQTTIIVTVVLFSIWIIALDTYAGVRHISPSLDEMGNSFGANRWQLLTKVLFWAALPEILAGVRMGMIRAVKGIVIGQLLVSVVAFGRLFRTFSDNFQFEQFWALTLILFVFALGFSSAVGWLEHKVEYYAGSRI